MGEVGSSFELSKRRATPRRRGNVPYFVAPQPLAARSSRPCGPESIQTPGSSAEDEMRLSWFSRMVLRMRAFHLTPGLATVLATAAVACSSFEAGEPPRSDAGS